MTLDSLTVDQATVVCGQREAMCTCIAEPSHVGPHQCACGGAWHLDDAGRFHIDAWPGGVGLGNPFLYKAQP